MWLPIVQRELRVASRRSATFWLRLLSPSCALLFIFSSLVSGANLLPQSRGQSIFKILAAVLFVLSLLAGLRYTADCIQEERRGGTLDLLKLAGLRGIDVVTGKLTANSLGAFFSLVAAFPILALPLLLGGVTGWALFQMTLLLAATLLLSLAIGIFASSQSLNQEAALKHAATVTAIISAVGLVGLFYLRSKNHFEKRSNTYPTIEHSTDFVVLFFVFIMMMAFNLPLGAPAVILLRIVRGDPASLLGHIAFWVSFIVLLSLIYYFLKKADPFQPETEKEERWEALSMWQARLKRGRFSKHSDPILWLIARTRSNGFSMTLLSSVVAILQFSVISAQNTFVASESSAWLAFLLFTFLAFVMARQCSSFLSESRANGMLEVLLVTPLSWEHLFKAQKTAFFSRITWPLGVIAAAEVAAELSLLTGDATGRFRLVGLLVPFLTIGAYFLCREAILWTSLAFALRSRNAIHAAGKTMLTLVLIPGLATYILPFEKFTALFPYGDLLLVNLYYIAIYAGFAAWNRTHVRQQFRPEASGDPQPTSIPRKLLKLIPVAKG